MVVSRVMIDEGCTACGLCEQICPEVFEVADIAQVKKGAEPNKYEEKVREAMDSCPVFVIKVV